MKAKEFKTVKLNSKLREKIWGLLSMLGVEKLRFETWTPPEDCKIENFDDEERFYLHSEISQAIYIIETGLKEKALNDLLEQKKAIEEKIAGITGGLE